MKSTAAKKEEFTFPSGGIADFYMEDHEIEALEKEEAEQEFGSAGIATFNPIARRMASYGRYGDDTVAHVETGELVVPKALIDSNPKLKDSIFSHLRELGVEDPEQYIVGSGVNSINPDTGMPEFFFKKIFKGIKKAVSGVAKGVGKILKKVAPIVLPIALAMTPLGPIYGAALGSGIGTLASGGSIQDAFKSALIAGGTGALFSGFTGKGASFTERVGNALSDPAGRLAQTTSGLRGTLTGKGLTGKGTLFSEFDPTKAASTEVASTTPISDATTKTFPEVTSKDFTGASIEYPGARNLSLEVKEPGMLQNLTDKFDTAGDYLFRGGQSKAEIAAAESLARSNQVAKTLSEYGYSTLADAPLSVQNAAIAAGDAAAKAAGPGLLATFGPSAALATAGLAAGGFFEKPEDPDLDIDDIQGVTGSDLLRDNPDAYMLAGRGSGTSGQVVVPTNYRFMGQMPDFRSIYPQFAADGGEIFPRRTGGIMPNEGTPGKDSVRAMLMPGEFVMTTDAVKGMGDGNNEKGINRMYDMMRNLESRGKAMA